MNKARMVMIVVASLLVGASAMALYAHRAFHVLRQLDSEIDMINTKNLIKLAENGRTDEVVQILETFVCSERQNLILLDENAVRPFGLPASKFIALEARYLDRCVVPDHA